MHTTSNLGCSVVSSTGQGEVNQHFGYQGGCAIVIKHTGPNKTTKIHIDF